MRYGVWECKIVVDADVAIPEGFDWPPRSAACNAVETAGIPIVACFSGWGGGLSEAQLAVIEDRLPEAGRGR